MRLVKDKDGSWRSWDNSIDDCMDRAETMEVEEVRQSDWIPTAERLPEQDNNRQVVVQWSDGNTSVVRSGYVDAEHIIAWQELPPPYVPPKPKRRRGWFKPNRLDQFNQSQDAFEAIEVLPGDPDPDVVLEVLESLKVAQYRGLAVEGVLCIWHDRIEESRSK